MYQVPICLVRFDENEKKPKRSERMAAISGKMSEEITDADSAREEAAMKRAKAKK